MSYYDTVHNSYPFHKASLLWRTSDLIHYRFQIVGNNLCNNFIDDISKRDWEILICGECFLLLWDECKKACITESEILDSSTTSQPYVSMTYQHTWKKLVVKPFGLRDFPKAISLTVFSTSSKDVRHIKFIFFFGNTSTIMDLVISFIVAS
jgi:hypothetical protein